jgi:hypothetical protein
MSDIGLRLEIFQLIKSQSSSIILRRVITKEGIIGKRGLSKETPPRGAQVLESSKIVNASSSWPVVHKLVGGREVESRLQTHLGPCQVYVNTTDSTVRFLPGCKVTREALSSRRIATSVLVLQRETRLKIDDRLLQDTSSHLNDDLFAR